MSLQLGLEIFALLQQVNTLEGGRVPQFRFDLGEPLLDRLGSTFPPTLRAILLECIEVVSYYPTLLSALRQCALVLGRHAG
jgi:hypothetical protein